MESEKNDIEEPASILNNEQICIKFCVQYFYICF